MWHSLTCYVAEAGPDSSASTKGWRSMSVLSNTVEVQEAAIWMKDRRKIT